MAAPAPRAGSSGADPEPPEPDPRSIRACLTPEVAGVFDAEWKFVLERAAVSQDLDDITALLHKWRLLAHTEQRDPGAYFRLLARAAELQAGVRRTSAVSGEEFRTRLLATP